ncbi:MAG: class I SAM-dependent methyltransferase [Candidatus Sungbacteria bacterium]|nr:class I SAM-dependent methyltransferase [Candidatus Sungbacteria bacterium]
MDQPDNFLHPERIIGALVNMSFLQKGSVIADFGAGHGYFSVPLGRATGPEGRVYAIDVQKAGLTIIRTKAKLEHLLQIEPVWADLDLPNGSQLNDGSVDLVLMANMLFQSEKKTNILQEAFRVLKSGCRALVIEWKPDDASFGPPVSLRVSAETIRRAAAHIGFSFERELPVGSHHYGLIFKKP